MLYIYGIRTNTYDVETASETRENYNKNHTQQSDVAEPTPTQ